MFARAVEYLLHTQNQDGGWGYAAGQTTCVEPTAATVIALQDVEEITKSRDKVVAWLRAEQHSDGGWGMTAEDKQSSWHTAWAILALTGLTDSAPLLERASDWLLAVPVLHSTSDEMQLEARRLLAIDYGLRGWPWLPDQASWVEPTALSILSLAGLPRDAQRDRRIQEAASYLTDRRCSGGGWNFGNPVMLGAELPSRAQPTAVALLALNAVEPDKIRLSDVSSLRKEMIRDGGALALGWGLLALRTLRTDDEQAAELLAEMQGPNGSWNDNAYHTALALLAYRGSL